jgi:hypothetical protein
VHKDEHSLMTASNDYVFLTETVTTLRLEKLTGHYFLSPSVMTSQKRSVMTRKGGALFPVI